MEIRKDKKYQEIYTSQIIEFLETSITDEMILNSYIRKINVSLITETSIFIKVSSPRAIHILNSSYLGNFEDAVKTVFDKNLKLNLILSEKDIENVPTNEQKEEPTTNKRSKSKKFEIKNNANPKFTFDKYIKSNFNAEVINAAERIIEEKGVFSPLFITSPSGLGKTHLLHSIANDYWENDVATLYVEPNKFTKMITDSRTDSSYTIDDYVKHLCQYDVLLFDDIQNLGDRSVTLKVLFQIVNHFIENDKQIVITSDKGINELSGFEDRFITRFSSGFTTSISNLEHEDIRALFVWWFENNNIDPQDFDEDALEFLIRNNSSSIRAIEGAGKRVKFFYRRGETVNRNWISGIFKDQKINQDEITPERVSKVISSYYGVSLKDIKSKGRKKEIVMARQMVMYMLKNSLKKTYVEIGKFLGRDHSTIMSGVKKIERMIASDASTKLAIKKIENNIFYQK